MDVWMDGWMNWMDGFEGLKVFIGKYNLQQSCLYVVHDERVPSRQGTNTAMINRTISTTGCRDITALFWKQAPKSYET